MKISGPVPGIHLRLIYSVREDFANGGGKIVGNFSAGIASGPRQPSVSAVRPRIEVIRFSAGKL